jgi:uncharacterized protein YbjT (DUF2867 family)
VGTDRLTESGYIRAKIAQEKLIRESKIQPVASDDVAAAMANANYALGSPQNGVVEIAGPAQVLSDSGSRSSCSDT